MTAYQELERRFRHIGLLREAAAILNWDSAAMMPPGGAGVRAEQMAALDVTIHEALAHPDMAELLDRAGSSPPPAGSWLAANLAEMQRDYVHAAAVPADLVAASSKAAALCETAWRTARSNNDFAGLRPLLQQVLDLTREIATIKAAALGCSPYDALLDQYEPGGKAAEIDRHFADLADFLPATIAAALEHQARQPATLPLTGPFAIPAQQALGKQLMAALGFDFDHGRLDISHHPFCGGTPDDVRITTRYREDDFAPAMMGVLHETGHALYERGLPPDWRHQPVGSARGMSLHESQSLLVEMQMCRSRAFFTYAAPLIRAAFQRDGAAWQAENLYRTGIRVRPGLIRVDADEVTYPAHVVLRYRLERALLSGDLALADLPTAWNDGMVEYLGICPPDDRDGCLQDVHWPSGAFGYFPTYTLGAMTAAQLYQAARAALPDLDDSIGRGEFSPLLAWLRQNIHTLAASRSTNDILMAATGRPLGVDAFRHHLETRYLGQ